MKAVILAGGLGSRLGEETDVKPKPMVSIDERPIIWHIMKIYSAFGINDFVICLGYKGYVIKEYFSNYFLHTSDITIDLEDNSVKIHRKLAEPWRVTLVDTGPDSMTGGRLKRVGRYVSEEDAFCMTYGDGVANVDIAASIRFHERHGRLATVTAVHQPGRFGALTMAGSKVAGFEEKPTDDAFWINGGFFVLSPKVLDYIEDDATIWEHGPMHRLAAEGQLHAYHHRDFWQCMDTLRDKRLLQQLWESGKAPWKMW